jgi:hypothetical protein
MNFESYRFGYFSINYGAFAVIVRIEFRAL